MADLRAFITTPRQNAPAREVDERLSDWKEVYQPQPEPLAQSQAARCMDCGIPFCHQGCPLGNLIPDWNQSVSKGNWQRAYKQLSSTNNFPEFTGRLCPAPCEAACTLAISADAVTIEQTEKEIIEKAFQEGWVDAGVVAKKTNKRVAVVGSGPAGLAAAAQLAAAGHTVTVFERDEAPGGLLRFGIPDFKLEKWVIDRRIDLMKKAGIAFSTGVTVGKDLLWKDVIEEYDAVLLAMGAQKARDLPVPGRDLKQVVFAMDYLGAQNRFNARGQQQSTSLHAQARRVVILGGGDTGSDCLGTALRQGAKQVKQIELLPMPPQRRDMNNPWPQWPMVFRSSSSHKEGGEREFAMLTKKLSGKDGVLKTLHAVKVELNTSGEGGPFREIPGSDIDIPVDLLILAMGFTGPWVQSLVEQTSIQLDARGCIQVNPSFETSLPGVYCAGDAHRGASLIVWAISEGREAARAIDLRLQKKQKTILPTRGHDAYFGGR
ncbi:MAG: glutamate synthase subunit beta [Myxococcales bacterium]|nr:MAG: glutamate synthase subunit beta [Myxococcales bacterium]